MDVKALIKRFCTLMQDPSGGSFEEPEALEWLNQALGELQAFAFTASKVVSTSSTQFSVSANTTGVEEHDLPSGYRRATYVEKVMSGSKNIPIPYVDYRLHADIQTGTVNWPEVNIDIDEPSYYLRGDTKIGFIYPAEDMTVNLCYEAQWTEMSTGDTECPAPVGFHHLVALKAALLARELEGRKISTSLRDAVARQESAFIASLSHSQAQGPEYAV